MEMETLQPDQAKAFLESASYLEPLSDMGAQAVQFGIDNLGREFILIASMAGDVAKLGFL
ncbi:MAG: hypothetical protein WCK63_08880 [Betaproteobacteria bacterium]